MKYILLATLLLGSASAQKIGMLYDAGGKFDKSFNESAFNGSQRAAKATGVTVDEYVNDSTGDTKTNAGLQGLIAKGDDLILGVGFNNQERITSAAKANPSRHFGLIDAESDAKNVTNILFAEQEGSFLVGYIAAQTTSTGRIGFVGGMPIDLIYKFSAGFKAGALASGKKLTFTSVYVGVNDTDDSGWDNPKRASALTQSLVRSGVDVIFAAAGASGNGVIDYINQKECLKASELPAGVRFGPDTFAKVPKSASYKAKCAGNSRPLFFIGVDSNQNYLGDTDKNPKTLNHGLTSMLKRIDNAVFSVISEFKAGTLKSGSIVYGIKEGGVGYALDEYNRALLPRLVISRTERLKSRIIYGQTKVAGR